MGLAWLIALVEPKWLRSEKHRWGAAVWRTTALWNIYIYIYVCTYISISRAETVELRNWISQRSQRQLRQNGMLPDKYLETQTGSSRRSPWYLYVHMYVGRSLNDATSWIRSFPACNRIHLQTHAGGARLPKYVHKTPHSCRQEPTGRESLP